MKKIFVGILTGMLMLSPVIAQDTPNPNINNDATEAVPYVPEKMEVTGVAVVAKPQVDPRNPKGPKLGSSAIVNGQIWWEGQTIKVRKDDDSWVTLTLTKVEMVKGKGGVCTFTVELASSDKPTFKVSIKKSSGWGLEKAK
jgi:hypothetical protein